MKKLFTLTCMVLATLTLSAQKFVPLKVNDTDTLSIQHAATEAVDMNNDGTLDILISGDGIGVIADGIFISNGDKTFTKSTDANVVLPGFLACIEHGDLDADGDIDFIFNGWMPGGSDPTNGIALNDGSGILSLSETLEIGTSAPSCGFADFNNDALMDYFFFGNGSATCAIWFQNQDGSFTKDNTSFASYNFTDPEVSIIDFNNDGYLDLFIDGWENNVSNRFSDVFLNDYFGAFSAMDQSNLIAKGYGSSTWFDVNADGNLDLLLNGDGGADGESSSNIYRLYKNNNGTLEEATTFSEYRQISVDGGARFADLDNDGDADIILTGWSDSESRQVTIIEECVDAANFVYTRHSWSDSDEVPGVSESDIEVADFNNDHKIDIVLSGYSGNFGRRVAGVIFNDMTTANTVPGAPSNLVVNNIAGGGFMFNWDAGTDTETPVKALTYSLYLKSTTTGKWLMNPEADLGTGKRKVTGLGNVDNSLSWPLYELPDGDYEWSVQSVDGVYEGSTFPTPQVFTIVDGVINTSGISTVEADYAKVFASDGTLYIRFTDISNNNEFSIYSPDGRLIDKNVAKSGEYSVALHNGLYIVTINGKNGLQTEKVLVL